MNIDEKVNKIRELFSNFTNANQNVIDEVLLDNKFLMCSGSGDARVHHYGDNGLLQHTLEVLELCDCVAKQRKISDKEHLNLMYAALYHDIGKTFDYDQSYSHTTNNSSVKYSSKWISSEHKYKIYHIPRSFHIWAISATKNNISEDDIFEVSHAILAHHQLPQWGSYVQPKTTIAWILHNCDNMSARIYECQNL